MENDNLNAINTHRFVNYQPSKEREASMKCRDCGSEDIHWLAWVDKDNKYIGESAYSENGEYWCDKCQKHKE